MTCRLFYLVGQLVPGGQERQLYLLLKSMDRSLYRPELAVWNFSENDTYVSKIRALGVRLHALPSLSSRVSKLQILRTMVREIQPEVIHSYTFFTNFAAYWAARGTSAVAVGSVRSSLTYAMNCAGPWLGRLSARWPRSQVSNNITSAGEARPQGGFFRPDRLLVVRNGIDSQEFRRVPLNLSRPACIVGVGSLFPVKRWDRLLRAARELKSRGLDFWVRIIGDGPLRDSLQRESDVLGLSDRVEFVGHRSDISSLLADARFLTHTSDSEGCPNAVMEAMACGRAVVATDVGDTRFLVEDGRTGFVVSAENEEILVERMVRLIGDPDLCERMGATGRTKAEQEFGLDRLVKETLDAYRLSGWKG